MKARQEKLTDEERAEWARALKAVQRAAVRDGETRAAFEAAAREAAALGVPVRVIASAATTEYRSWSGAGIAFLCGYKAPGTKTGS